MSVTAKQLSQTAARGKDIQNIIRDQIQLIDKKLLETPKVWGRNVVPCDLPTTIAIPGLNKQDAQKIVYSSIVRSLESRGFEVRLLLTEAKEREPAISRIYIAWVTDLDVAEVEAMNALVKQKRIAPEEVEKFRTQGAIAAPRTALAARQGDPRAEHESRMTVTESRLVMRPREGVGKIVSNETQKPSGGISAEEAAILNSS